MLGGVAEGVDQADRARLLAARREGHQIGAQFVGDGPSCLVLGDNLLYGHGLSDMLRRSGGATQGATVFAYRVEDPQRYGVVAFDGEGRARSIEEKPAKPASEWSLNVCTCTIRPSNCGSSTFWPRLV